jgi:preprotein translocase SecF subunit
MWWNKPDPNRPPPKEGKPFPFMKLRFLGFLGSITVIVLTTLSLWTQGLNMGLDFTGGVQIEATRASDPYRAGEVDEVRARIKEAGFEDSNVTTADNGAVLIRVMADISQVNEVSAKVQTALGDNVSISVPAAVGPKVSGELFRNGVIASIMAVVGIALYIWFRFESKFAWSALLTTFHDVYAVIGLFTVTQMTFDLTIIAAILTVAGYSINDTVVVFDRIREMLKKYKKLPLNQIIDISITATLSRTLITSIATLLASGAMMMLGGPVLFGFAAAIVFGIVIGTLSSIFVAAPLLIHLPGRVPGSRPAGADQVAEAAS